MRRLLLAALLGVLVLSACSGGDAEPASSPSPTASAPSRADGPSAEAVAFCEAYNAVLGSGAMSDAIAGADTPDAAAAELRKTVDEIEQVTTTAPEEIRADLTLVNDTNARSVRALADLLEGEHGEVLWPYFQRDESPASIPDDASEEELAARDAAEAWSTAAQNAFAEDVIQASERVGDWYRSNCVAA